MYLFIICWRKTACSHRKQNLWGHLHKTDKTYFSQYTGTCNWSHW